MLIKTVYVSTDGMQNVEPILAGKCIVLNK